MNKDHTKSNLISFNEFLLSNPLILSIELRQMCTAYNLI